MLELAREVPTHVWGRDALGVHDRWNSNSLIAWLIGRSGLPVDTIHPPVGGRAPSWDAGLSAARQQQRKVPEAASVLSRAL
jgi:hypothetical protein